MIVTEQVPLPSVPLLVSKAGAGVVAPALIVTLPLTGREVPVFPLTVTVKLPVKAGVMATVIAPAVPDSGPV